MTSLLKPRSFLLTLLMSALAAGLIAHTTLWAYSNLGCPGYEKPGYYLAHCTSPHYGDYEHGAYYHAFEPAAVRNLREAEVLLLGNSRVQFGYSTVSVQNFFQAEGIRYHLIGFGYADGLLFESELIKRLGLKPRFLFIDVSPFFKPFLSEPARALMGRASSSPVPGVIQQALAWSDTAKKWAFNRLHPKLCRLLPDRCSVSARAIYRRSEDGAWDTEPYVAGLSESPIVASKAVALSKTPTAEDLKSAADLLRLTGVSADCVVLTVSPTNALDVEPYAREMSRALGWRLIMPQLNGMMTIDGSHLALASAERWSAEVLRLSSDFVRKCTKNASASDPSHLPIRSLEME